MSGAVPTSTVLDTGPGGLDPHDQDLVRPPSRQSRLSLRRDGVGLVGMIVLLLMILAALLAPWIAPHDPLDQSVLDRFKPPVWSPGGDPEYLLGTDNLGRDVLSRTLYAGRISLAIGVTTAILSALLGSILGILGAWHGKWFASVLLRVIEVQIAFPSLVVAIAVIAVFGSSVPTLILTLLVWVWVPFARVAYDSTLKIKRQEFVAAARVSSLPGWRILVRHVLPNIAAPLLVIWTFAIAQVIVIESALSFLGLGIQPPTPTWGSMVSQGRLNMEVAWWAVAFPSIAIALVVLSVNMVGDWLRDRYDPQLASHT